MTPPSAACPPGGQWMVESIECEPSLLKPLWLQSLVLWHHSVTYSKDFREVRKSKEWNCGKKIILFYLMYVLWYVCICAYSHVNTYVCAPLWACVGGSKLTADVYHSPTYSWVSLSQLKPEITNQIDKLVTHRAPGILSPPSKVETIVGHHTFPAYTWPWLWTLGLMFVHWVLYPLSPLLNPNLHFRSLKPKPTVLNLVTFDDMVRISKDKLLSSISFPSWCFCSYFI